MVAPRHPWARYGGPVPLEALRAAEWVLREPGSGTRSTFESALACVPSIALETSSTTSLVGAALAGVGPAVVSARAVSAELEAGRLVEVGTGLDLLRPLTAVWAKDVRMSGPVAELLRIAAGAADQVRQANR